MWTNPSDGVSVERMESPLDDTYQLYVVVHIGGERVLTERFASFPRTTSGYGRWSRTYNLAQAVCRFITAGGLPAQVNECADRLRTALGDDFLYGFPEDWHLLDERAKVDDHIMVVLNDVTHECNIIVADTYCDRVQFGEELVFYVGSIDVAYPNPADKPAEGV